MCTSIIFNKKKIITAFNFDIFDMKHRVKTNVLGVFIINTLVILSFLILNGCSIAKNNNKRDNNIIGISWQENKDIVPYKYLTKSLDALNINYVLLDQVIIDELYDVNRKLKSEYIDENDYLTLEAAHIVKNAKISDTNFDKVMQNISGVIFGGGSDISPTLYSNPEKWHGIEEEKDYDASRDVNDYLLMKFCIENDVPVMGICRGMQFLSLVSGAKMIQDIPSYFKSHGIEYDYSHRMNKNDPNIIMDFSAHDITIKDLDSIIGGIIKKDKIEKAPSWHHQAVISVKNTPLKATGISEKDGIEIIEAIERIDKSYVVGYQFHLETAIGKNVMKEKNANNYMDLKEAEDLFLDFNEYCMKNK